MGTACAMSFDKITVFMWMAGGVSRLGCIPWICCLAHFCGFADCFIHLWCTQESLMILVWFKHFFFFRSIVCRKSCSLFLSRQQCTSTDNVHVCSSGCRSRLNTFSLPVGSVWLHTWVHTFGKAVLHLFVFLMCCRMLWSWQTKWLRYRRTSDVH